jgi:hypothetical protein
VRKRFARSWSLCFFLGLPNSPLLCFLQFVNNFVILRSPVCTGHQLCSFASYWH